MAISDADRRHLERAVELAAQAVEAGDEPFGSLLVSPDGEVLLEDHNHVAGGDRTRHPELAIARWAAEHLDEETRRRCTVYTSGEHCPMCAAAHGWAALGRIVYASSSEQLVDWSRELGAPAAPVAPLPIRAVVPDAVVDGPDDLLAEQVRRLHARRLGARDRSADDVPAGRPVRRAIIFHGTRAHPDVVWLPWLRERLRRRGYDVEVPHYPELNVEPIRSFLPRVLASHTFDEDTVLVGHSGGAALLLAILERIDTPVDQAILVAGYSTPPNDADEPVLQESYDWAAIRAGVRDLYVINSVDDPYGCDDTQGRAIFEQLGGTQIVRDDGHFGDVDQPFESFELLDRLIG